MREELLAIIEKNSRIDLKELAVILGKWNPMAYLLSAVRNALIYNQSPDWKWMLIWFAISLLLCMAGIRLVYRNENNYVKGI